MEDTESESVDTDPEEHHISRPYKEKREILQILKRTTQDNDQKDLSDMLDKALEQSPNSYFYQTICREPTSPTINTTRIDSESVAEYLILEDGDSSSSNGTRSTPVLDSDTGVKKKLTEVKEVTFAKRPKPLQFQISEVKEDCDSFYGSDKETDDAIIFSDDTEVEVGSSSSEDSEVKKAEDVLDKVEF